MEINLNALLAQSGARPKTVAAPQAAAARPAAEPAPSVSLESVAEQLNASAASAGRSLSFQVDDASGQTVISVVDTYTGQMIRQIPSIEALKLAARLEEIQGQLFDQTV